MALLARLVDRGHVFFESRAGREPVGADFAHVRNFGRVGRFVDVLFVRRQTARGVITVERGLLG